MMNREALEALEADAELPERLMRRLAAPLPGRQAQRRMSPELAYGRHFGPAPSSARQAAVLALLYPVESRWKLLLTLRREGLSSHSGQVCFPGGMAEAYETLEQTALREFVEELGADASGFRSLGALSPLWVHVSNTLVTPFVAAARERPLFVPSADEVAEILESPLAELFDPANRGQHWVERRGLTFRAPHYLLQGRQVWGATSMMIAELLQALQELK
jgi:8-oxo-dGTP pyrophosphatase MutT (NUDIX family)